MKYVSYIYDNKNHFGIVEQDQVYQLTDIHNCPNLLTWIEKGYDFNDIDLKTLKILDLKSVILTAPIIQPRRNVICLGKNYVSHALESKSIQTKETIPPHPIYFTKGQAEILGTEARINLSEIPTTSLDYEAELTIVIGKKGKNISREEVWEYIYGLTLANDFSARDLQNKHQQWFKGKSLDQLLTMGPAIIPVDKSEDKLTWDIKCWVNDELRQDSNTEQLIFSIEDIFVDLSQGFTLLPGDLIMTGTPAGVGIGFEPPKYLRPGDTVKCYVPEIGYLTNYLY